MRVFLESGKKHRAFLVGDTFSSLINSQPILTAFGKDEEIHRRIGFLSVETLRGMDFDKGNFRIYIDEAGTSFRNGSEQAFLSISNLWDMVYAVFSSESISDFEKIFDATGDDAVDFISYFHDRRIKDDGGNAIPCAMGICSKCLGDCRRLSHAADFCALETQFPKTFGRVVSVDDPWIAMGIKTCSQEIPFGAKPVRFLAEHSDPNSEKSCGCPYFLEHVVMSLSDKKGIPRNLKPGVLGLLRMEFKNGKVVSMKTL